MVKLGALLFNATSMEGGDMAVESGSWDRKINNAHERFKVLTDFPVKRCSIARLTLCGYAD
jgi:hypothetical protein